jgi:hypothetical protein
MYVSLVSMSSIIESLTHISILTLSKVLQTMLSRKTFIRVSNCKNSPAVIDNKMLWAFYCIVKI